MTDQLKIFKIEKEYEGKPLLKGISFEVNTGEVLCLLGRSGSGKSTLLRIIAGIETAEGGQVLWNGEDMGAVPTHLRRFGLMFQDYALFPHLNVFENIAFGLRMQNLPKDVITQKVNSALQQVNLSGFEDRGVAELSGGEQQRVALARALAPEPRLLMLDEPLAALDRSLRAQLQEELREVLHQTNIPAIYVTHDQDEALALSDRLALLNEGKIVQIGPPEDIYSHPHDSWVAQFLGMENVLKGSVRKTDPLVIATAFGNLQVASAAKSRFEANEPVHVILLSMDVEMVPEKTMGNDVSLTVETSIFKGDHYRTIARNEKDAPLVFNLKSKTARGDKITIRLSPDSLYVCK